MKGYNRYTKIFIKRRYHTLHTLIGRRLHGTSVGLSLFGIAVSSDNNSGCSIPVSRVFCNKSRSRLANYVFDINSLMAPTLIPNAPTAAYERMSFSASLTSSTVNSYCNSAMSAGDKVGKSYKNSLPNTLVTLGLLKNLLKYSLTYYYGH
jgi:hypothetical protein